MRTSFPLKLSTFYPLALTSSVWASPSPSQMPIETLNLSFFLARCSHRPWLWLTPSSIIALSPGTWIWWQSRVNRLSRLLSSSVKQFSRSLRDKEDDTWHSWNMDACIFENCIAWRIKLRSVAIGVLEITGPDSYLSFQWKHTLHLCRSLLFSQAFLLRL